MQQHAELPCLGNNWRDAASAACDCWAGVLGDQAVNLNSAFLDISQHFTGHLFSPRIPSSARGIDGGPRRFTEVVFNELSLPVAGSGRVQETLPEPPQRIP
jgi:hypothetical protein